MDLDALLQNYFGTADLDTLDEDAIEAGRERVAVAFGTERDSGRRFALWIVLHALGDALGTSDRVALAAFIDGIDRWIGEKLRTDDANANLVRLARLAEVWEKIVRAARDTESYNLERKPLVFSVFGMLAEATR